MDLPLDLTHLSFFSTDFEKLDPPLGSIRYYASSDLKFCFVFFFFFKNIASRNFNSRGK